MFPDTGCEVSTLCRATLPAHGRPCIRKSYKLVDSLAFEIVSMEASLILTAKTVRHDGCWKP